ncbi:Rho-binding antiterminator [Cellvibrio japonicus]|uniref:Modulator of Rho-dependent transcription termination (ROF) superfamily n=1 Tax=Cellvibrio japonicus (strain Ueda107) TaxID=498211 RepID=B3PH51_CELJU|nr:Rho-binding antiterminator [Cellvibrio japonicus]ACE83502.1 Modulator of Rho-dependent transcription termination (ROF) superfamily [Cellvibrio japonicus Ueda107]QEI10978.1 transcriptional regulator [Cellvibrio japonicus]QEI14554.1 transcriptional regulator [Cellvibrio japonicus]QEI18132.1 transcriptional regulator [Cellvibrio japonicus]
MIHCDQHDYIEIVCLYHYPIRLTLTSGATIEGIAQDTQHNDQREECIKLSTDTGEQLVVLSELKQLDVLVENPHVERVVFG